MSSQLLSELLYGACAEAAFHPPVHSPCDFRLHSQSESMLHFCSGSFLSPLSGKTNCTQHLFKVIASNGDNPAIILAVQAWFH